MIVIGGSASEQLAERVAKEVGVDPARTEIKKFPDGETYIRIHNDVKGQDVAVIQSLYRTPDPYIFEYLLLVDTLRDLGARSIIGVAPYLAYARQDARFYPGEAVTSSSVARLFEAAGTTSFLSIDCHLHRLGDVSKVFRIPAQNLSAMQVLGRYARETFKPKNPIVIAPDEEADQWAAVVAKELDSDHVVFHKTRVRKEGLTSSKVEVDTGQVDLRGKDVVFADDIISTGGTIAEGAKACKKNGARRIFALCTHPVLAEGALKRIKAAGIVRVIGTDTIPSPISKVSVAPVIAQALRNII
jgi:ribose-phosphate pyrophosphokinase